MRSRCRDRGARRAFIGGATRPLIAERSKENGATIRPQILDEEAPANYCRALRDIPRVLRRENGLFVKLTIIYHYDIVADMRIVQMTTSPPLMLRVSVFLRFAQTAGTAKGTANALLFNRSPKPCEPQDFCGMKKCGAWSLRKKTARTARTALRPPLGSRICGIVANALSEEAAGAVMDTENWSMCAPGRHKLRRWRTKL